MKSNLRIITFTATAAVLAGTIAAQSTPNRTAPQPRKGSAETRLVGINLFDTGMTVVAKFGSPDEVQGLTIGGGQTGGGGGAPAGGGGPEGGEAGARGGGGRPGGGGVTVPGRRGGGSPAGGVAPGDAGKWSMPYDPTSSLPGFIGNPFGSQGLNQAAPSAVPGGASPAGGPPGGGGGRPAQSGPGGGPAGGGGGRGGDAEGGGVGGGAGQSERVTVTRWVYKRAAARYAFVLDKFNRVVQMEAIGLFDKSPATKRGIRFGSTFSDVIKKYNAPDGYEISGSNIVMRYLVMDRVAFRLSKTDPKKPHVVTGIVVAAGKA